MDYLQEFTIHTLTFQQGFKPAGAVFWSSGQRMSRRFKCRTPTIRESLEGALLEALRLFCGDAFLGHDAL